MQQQTNIDVIPGRVEMNNCKEMIKGPLTKAFNESEKGNNIDRSQSAFCFVPQAQARLQ